MNLSGTISRVVSLPLVLALCLLVYTPHVARGEIPAGIVVRSAEIGEVDFLRLLLGRGADANSTSALGVSALMAASENGHESSVRLLLDRGADPSRVAGNGDTAISLGGGGGVVAVYA